MNKMPKKIEKHQELIRWFIKFRLQSGLEECYPISTSEKEHLWKNLPRLCEEKGINFFDFYSENHCILVQSSQISFFQFLFEPPYFTCPQDSDKDDEEEDADAYAVKIYLNDDPNPMVFYVDEDVPNPHDEGDLGEMNNFAFFTLHVGDEDQWVHFMTEDGETAYFRGANIALAEIPLKVLEKEEASCDEVHTQWDFQAGTVH